MTVVVGVPDVDARVEPIREAARLADGLDEPLHVVHVRREGDFEGLDGEEGTPTFGAIRDAAADVATTASERAFDGGTDAKPSPVEHVGLVGDPAETLIEHATHVDASLIVVGGTRRSPVGKAVFGDVTQDVLYKSACPVVSCLADDD